MTALDTMVLHFLTAFLLSTNFHAGEKVEAEVEEGFERQLLPRKDARRSYVGEFVTSLALPHECMKKDVKLLR